MGRDLSSKNLMFSILGCHRLDMAEDSTSKSFCLSMSVWHNPKMNRDLLSIFPYFFSQSNNARDSWLGHIVFGKLITHLHTFLASKWDNRRYKFYIFYVNLLKIFKLYPHTSSILIHLPSTWFSLHLRLMSISIIDGYIYIFVYVYICICIN